MVIFIYEETTMKREATDGRQNPVAICWDFHKLNSLGRHARGVSKLNDNRVSFFSAGWSSPVEMEFIDGQSADLNLQILSLR